MRHFVAWLAMVFVSSVEGALDPGTELLIDQLPKVSQIGYGYSAMFSGAQFLPEPDSSQIHTLVLGTQAPSNSPALESIVRKGYLAVPSLLKHLDDRRPTMIPKLSGMMWMSFADEYDYNRRLRSVAPKGVNRDTFNEKHPSSHILTVGDLCFVALGQIVNRNFNASRYQPSGGLVVNSPTYSKRLCEVVRADFANLTEKTHRELLVQDFQAPDHEFRRIGACRRLAFYYPDVAEPLVLRQLAVPTFNGYKIYDFLQEQLYRARSTKARKVLFDQFLSTNGTAYSEGILLALFDELDTQEANEQGRRHPPLKPNEEHDVRSLLTELYGFSDGVHSTSRPYATNWSFVKLARFIDGISNVRSQKVDEAVYGIFMSAGVDEFVAIACMKRLIGGRHDEEFRRYCELQIPKSSQMTNELRELLSNLEANKSKATPRRPRAVEP